MENTDLFRYLNYEVPFSLSFKSHLYRRSAFSFKSISRLVDEYVWDIDEYMDMDINNKIANPTDAKLATMV